MNLTNKTYAEAYKTEAIRLLHCWCGLVHTGRFRALAEQLFPAAVREVQALLDTIGLAPSVEAKKNLGQTRGCPCPTGWGGIGTSVPGGALGVAVRLTGKPQAI
jgi:hypothetical protein